MSTATIDPERLAIFTGRAFESAGASPSDAKLAADVLVRTEMRGVKSHGLRSLPMYLNQLRRGGADPHHDVEVVNGAAGTALVDARAGLGLAVAAKATDLAIDRARANGIGLVAVRNSNHFGAAGYYALRCAEKGLIGLVMSNGSTIMRVTGSRGSVLSNAPFAYGFPAPNFPVVLDIAMSAAAGGRIRVAAERGELLPEGWIVNSLGLDSRDPNEYVNGGSLVPIGDHKGYGLAIMVTVLGAMLSGAALNVGKWMAEPEKPTDAGHAFIAISIESLCPLNEFLNRMQALADKVHGAEKRPGVSRILLPGEIEHEKEQAARSAGVALEQETWESLLRVAHETGIHLDREGVSTS